jgi:hypothetical protein
VTQDDVDELRVLGLTDEEIFDVILAAAARSFFAKALDATGTAPDAAFRQLEPDLVEALTVGRPIAEETEDDAQKEDQDGVGPPRPGPAPPPAPR